MLDNGHLLVITLGNLILIYPENEPNDVLNGLIKQKWTYKKICSVSQLIIKKAKIKKGLILLSEIDHFKIIQRSEYNLIEYNICEIY